MSSKPASNRRFKVAVVGASGAVGETMLSILAEREFPASEVIALASERSAGSLVKYGNDDIVVQDLATFDPAGVEIALFSAGGGISKEYGPKFAAAGAVVIDNSSTFRYDDDVPLVVSEVNPEQVGNRPRGIIANPNCSTMQLMVALKPLHDAAKIERINVATYQSVSGAGRSGLEELGIQTGQLLNFQEIAPKKFQAQIAFNLIPHIDDFQPNGYTKEEMKLVWETRKILGDEAIQVNPTAVRVPVFYGHSEAVNIETRDKLSVEQARELLERAPGVVVVDEHTPGGYPTPVTHASGSDAVYVGRIREDFSHPRGLNLWVVSDNIRKGAALNAVQIAELVASEG
ncbi:aspartate-semialdehyde dehydrogenase [Thermomonas aquatica]|uniref:Aspartate-semialdehyde dehydrogenase n=1 Tax=Thermomonas aquatica TaxID=2202149 RepID=A0A5B7ZX02_9GAMM|nr:aspartate-semialdehyde dehydrogenase [Thermomonas aquatica]QDA58342.1 aspartate-semialdehyde dehydrogenase [Thermomonas aquatica]